ncbi:acyltransferase family protein [Epibacterium sp. SM1979]|uniref:Acyltransferase family protein n=1 Tax=Tritonibacter litoralis TaxID=2662264 RepID=A0A843YGM3_9RHOB|nr:acyltransferase family protein [Tritonibacter litoralis]MQQ08413.1 acyltransferase family protein [Tritonibacter litoralis]
MSHPNHALAYRPEIDGMRAIAVISVMIYHLKISMGDSTLLKGGFLGVDLFFVLSGFLITQILIREFNTTGKISIRQFYWRRAKRILPPLLAVMLVSLPAAWVILLPSELERFSLSLLSALAFISNGFWFFELSEYGAQSGLLQPFLHTWSLAIEEQYYIVFPPLLILLLRRGSLRIALWVMVGAALVSLIASEALTELHPSLSFYSPTSRAWELLAGSILAALTLMRPDGLMGGVLQRVVPALSLVVFFACIIAFDLAKLAHPGLVTLPVILATCGLIWFMRPGDPVTDVLASGPMVYIGKLSYSIYLWHFPVFAFGRLTTLGSPPLADMVIWVLLTFVLAAGSYYLVERPFRFNVAPKRFAMALVAALVPIVGGTALVATGSLSQTGRLQAMAELYGKNEMDNTILAQASWGPLDDATPDEEIGSWNAQRPSEHEKHGLWFSRDDSRKMLIIGDSHSKDLFNALTLNQDLFPDFEFARFNLHRKSLDDDLATLLAAPNFEAADIIVFAPRYYREYKEATATVLAAVQPSGKEVVLIGPGAEFDAGGAQPLFDWYLQMSGGDADLFDLNALALKFEEPTPKERENVLRRIAQDAQVTFYSRRELVCSADGTAKGCTIVTPDGFKAMYDSNHWTLEGAKLFGKRAAEAGWFSTELSKLDQTTDQK